MWCGEDGKSIICLGTLTGRFWEDARVETPKARDCAATGMWADRDDLDDPAAYVRNLRKRRTFA